MATKHRLPLILSALNRAFLRFKGYSRRSYPCRRQQSPSGLVQVRQGHQRKHLRRVLGQPLVTGLAVTELAFDDAEDMLDFCPYRGMFLVPRRSTRKRNVSVAVYDDPRVAVGAGRVDGVGARAEA